MQAGERSIQVHSESSGVSYRVSAVTFVVISHSANAAYHSYAYACRCSLPETQKVNHCRDVSTGNLAVCQHCAKGFSHVIC